MPVEGGNKSDRSTFFKEISNTPIHTTWTTTIERDILLILQPYNTDLYTFLIKASIKTAQRSHLINGFLEVDVFFVML